MGWVEDFGMGPVALDSMVFIYWIENHADYASSLVPLFEAMDQGRLTGFASELVLVELLVLPCRKGLLDLAREYRSILSNSRGLTLVPVGRRILDRAARIRAEKGIRTPDAIHLATAIETGCVSFISNDTRIPEWPGITRVSFGRCAPPPTPRDRG
jgi:predicted nucleic acid-binding protein